MVDDPRPYSDRPAARPDPDRIKAQEAGAAAASGSGGRSTEPGGCLFGCFVLIMIVIAISIIITIIGSFIPG